MGPKDLMFQHNVGQTEIHTPLGVFWRISPRIATAIRTVLFHLPLHYNSFTEPFAVQTCKVSTLRLAWLNL